MKAPVDKCTVSRRCYFRSGGRLSLGSSWNVSAPMRAAWLASHSFERLDGEPLPFGRGRGISRGGCLLTSDSPPRCGAGYTPQATRKLVRSKLGIFDRTNLQDERVTWSVALVRGSASSIQRVSDPMCSRGKVGVGTAPWLMRSS